MSHSWCTHTLRLLTGRDAIVQLLRFAEYVAIPWRVQSIRRVLDNRTHLQAKHAARMQDSSLLVASHFTDCKFIVEREEHFPNGSQYVQAYRRETSWPPYYTIYIYVADIHRRPEIEISEFADDTAAFTSNKNIKYSVSNLQRLERMSDLGSWLYNRKTKISNIHVKASSSKIEANNSMVGRGKIFGHTLRKKLDVERTH